MENRLSMPAGECGMLAGILTAMLQKCIELDAFGSHVFTFTFTDSTATKSTVNRDRSPSPQLTFLITCLTTKLQEQELAKETGTRTVQLLAVHVAGVRNVGADCLSRAR